MTRKTGFSSNDFALIYLLLTNVGPKKGRRQGWRWRDLCEELNVRDHGLAITLKRLKRMGGILRIEPEGRETYYSIAPSWKKKNEPLTAVIAAIGSAESNYSESMISEAIPKVMQNFGQADFEKLTQEQRAIIKCTLDHIQQIGPDIFATFGKMKEINRCLAAIYILRLKGNDELAELFMRMCKKQTDILVDSYMRVIGSAAIMRREILSRLREAKKAGTISNQEYRDAVTQYEQQVLVPKIRIEIPDDLSEKKFLREITDDYLIQK